MTQSHPVKIVFVLMMLLCLVTSCQHVPEGEPEGSLLVILSGMAANDGRAERYEIIDLQGHRRDISKTLGAISLPNRSAAWSPLGDRVAFACGIENDDSTWIFDVDIATLTAQKYPLPDDGYPYALTWSQDGSSLLFIWAHGYPELPEIWSLDRATQQITILSQSLVGATCSTWSPDRSKIAFATSGTWVQVDPHTSAREDVDLYIQSIDGAKQRLVYEDVAEDVEWSPDGQYIAFQGVPNWPKPDWQLCWVAVESGRVTCLDENGIAPTWSPDSKQIAFSGHFGIRVVNIQSKDVRTLMDLEDDGKGAYHLDWSPDGEYLAYQKCFYIEAINSCEIYVISKDGKKHHRLTRNNFSDEFPVWQPTVTQ